MSSIDALISALNDYEGGFVIVSHDAHLISAVCDNIWVVADKRVTPFDGDFEEYRTKMLKNKAIKLYQ